MNPTRFLVFFKYAMAATLFVGVLTTNVFAGPPAEPKPVVVKGKITTSYQIKAEDVELVFPDGEVKPQPDPKRLPTLRCEVLVPSVKEPLTFNTIITKLEDDGGTDLLVAHRARTGDPGYYPCSGGVAVQNGKAAIDLAIFRTSMVTAEIPRKYSRAVGNVMLSIPTEMTEFEFDAAVPAVAAITETETATFVPMHSKDGKDEMDVNLTTTAPEKFLYWDGLGNLFRSYQSFDEAGKPVRTELIAFRNDGLTVRFMGGAGAQVKKFRLRVISRTLRVTLPFDLRWNVQM